MTAVYDGLMPGRAQPEQSPGRWWAYKAVAGSLDRAIMVALELVAESPGRSCAQEAGHYGPVRSDREP